MIGSEISCQTVFFSQGITTQPTPENAEVIGISKLRKLRTYFSKDMIVIQLNENNL
jgi:hypothetical protein